MKSNRGKGIISIKPRLKSVWFSWFNVFFLCLIPWYVSIVPRPYVIYFLPLWHDIAYLCWKCRRLGSWNGIWPVKSWVLVCWWWQFDWSFARLIATVVTTISEWAIPAKAGMAHSDCGWTCGCAGKTVKSLENMCRTWALLWWWFTTKKRCIKCMHLYLYLRHPYKTG